MEENAKIAAQKSGRLSFYVVNAIADGCTFKIGASLFMYPSEAALTQLQTKGFTCSFQCNGV